MDYPFTYNWKIGEYVVSQIEGIANIQRDPDGDWYIEGISFEGVKIEGGRFVDRRMIEMPKDDLRYPVICEQIHRDDYEDIADAWAIHELEDGPARHGDEQYDLMVAP